MKKLSILVAGVVTALAIFAIGCGGDDGPETSSTGGGSEVAVSRGGGGLVAQNIFLTYDGGRYELVHFLQVELVGESEFRAIGEATEAGIPLKGGPTVFERENDPDSVYTLSPATEDDGAMWLRWRKS